MGFCYCFVVCYFVHSGFAIILMGKRELVALLCLSSWCLVMVVWLFLKVPWVCLQFVIVVSNPDRHKIQFLICLVAEESLHPYLLFPDHTH